MYAEDFGDIFAQYAEANNVIMVFPQAIGGWNANTIIGSETTLDDQYTRNGRINRYMKALIDRGTTARESTYTADLAAGEYTFGSLYSSGGKGDGGGGGGEKDSWEFDEGTGVWTNSATGETWSGDKTGEKGKAAWGDKGTESKDGDKSGWDGKDKDDVAAKEKEGWSYDEASGQWTNASTGATKDAEGKDTDDKAIALTATFMVALTASMNLM